MADPGKHEALLLQLLAISRELTREPNLGDVLQRIVDAAIRFTNAQRGFLCLREGSELNIAVARNYGQKQIEDAHQKLSQVIIQQVIRTGVPIITRDAPQDDRLAHSTSIQTMQVHSVICIPLKLSPTSTDTGPPAEPEVIGCVYLDHSEAERFGERDVEVLELFGTHAALAAKNARLVEMLQRRNSQLNAQLQKSANELVQTNSLLRSALADSTEKYDLPGIVYASRAMHEILGLVHRIADQKLPILITGESGTGKELLASAIHTLSLRPGRFVAVNCGAIPPELFESEFFGHRRGAFTGADRERVGLIESAHGGTLFLDEVADLSLQHQVKLLRVLQSGEVRRLGEDVTRHVDIRVLSACNRNLLTEVGEGRFREDLFYRLCVFQVETPPLRDRLEDIPLLVDAIVREVADSPADATVDPAVYNVLSNYHWPGNVRELRNEITRALAIGRGHITEQTLSAPIQNAPSRTLQIEALRESAQSLEAIMAAVERAVLVQTLEKHGGNKSKTARELQISRNGLNMKMARLEINEAAQ